MREKSKALLVAFCGVMTALCLALMLCSTVLPILTYTMPALSGILLLVAALSLGQSAAWVIYVCVSLLSMLFVADKECAILFVLFFGYYPILKLKMDGLRSRVLKIILKTLLFNGAVVVSQYLVVYVLGVPFELIEGLGKWTVPLLLLLANCMFWLYDWMLFQFRRGYCLKWHKSVDRLFRR